MEDDFQVSVIIPVYNAAQYVRNAVNSALAIDCVAEILLIEDASPDNALEICRELSRNHERVKLFQHPKGENRGAGASRNLGMEKARSAFISFLDADDYYLPNRFEETKELFDEYIEVDFTFGTAQYENEYLLKSNNFKGMPITKYNNAPLLRLRLCGGFDAFHTNTITIKKASLRKLNHFFNTHLRLHQDTEFWLRMAYRLKGKSEQYGRTTAVVRQHDLNRITQKNEETELLLWKTIAKEFKGKRISAREKAYIFLHLNLKKKQSNSADVDQFIKRALGKMLRTIRSFEKREEF